MQEIQACPVCGNTHLHEFLRTRDYHYTQEEFALKRCEACTLIMTSPRPDNEKLAGYYTSPEYLSHASRLTSLIGRDYDLARHFTIQSTVKLVEGSQKPETELYVDRGTGEFIF